MADIQFYVVDTETNGLSVKMHEICEVSIIRASDRMQLSREIRVDKPENSSYDALRVTGKTLDDLKRGITKLQMINEFHEFIEQDGVEPNYRCFIAHNTSFDRGFMVAMWEKFGRRFPFDLYLDTIPMFKDYCNKQGITKTKANLTAACEVLGIKKYGSAHNAKIDTRHTYLLWEHLSKTIDFMNHIKQLPHNIE